LLATLTISFIIREPSDSRGAAQQRKTPAIASPSMSQPIYIEAPRHPDLQALLAYWTGKRGSRDVPPRADIHPSEIKTLLPDVMIWNVGRDGAPHTIRLVGENIVRFVGANNTGQPATNGMPDDAAATMNAVLTEVAVARLPRFRVGKAFWHREKSYREFEACYLPLSTDGETVDMILGGLKFDVKARS
jgi:hypothetical protein